MQLPIWTDLDNNLIWLITNILDLQHFLMFFVILKHYISESAANGKFEIFIN
jgi:hypothetical protein